MGECPPSPIIFERRLASECNKAFTDDRLTLVQVRHVYSVTTLRSVKVDSLEVDLVEQLGLVKVDRRSVANLIVESRSRQK